MAHAWFEKKSQIHLPFLLFVIFVQMKGRQESSYYYICYLISKAGLFWNKFFSIYVWRFWRENLIRWNKRNFLAWMKEKTRWFSKRFRSHLENLRRQTIIFEFHYWDTNELTKKVLVIQKGEIKCSFQKKKVQSSLILLSTLIFWLKLCRKSKY